MHKFLSVTAITFFLMSPLYPVNQASAADLTFSAFAGCRVGFGNTISVGAGIRAAAGNDVSIACPLEKVVGDNLNFVFARINNSAAGGSSSFCNLHRRSHFNGSSAITQRAAGPAAGNQSLNIPLPAFTNTGYVFVTCLLRQNDTLYGIRYIQDD